MFAITAIVMSQTALADTASPKPGKPHVIVSVQAGNLHRLGLVDDDTSHIEGQYPVDELKFFKTGFANVNFRLDNRGYATDATPFLRTSDGFYDAALATISNVKMGYIKESSGPVNKFAANVIFVVPPCIIPKPWGNIDIQFTICSSPEPTAKLVWGESPNPRPNRTEQESPRTFDDAESRNVFESRDYTYCALEARGELELQQCLYAQSEYAERKLNDAYARVTASLSLAQRKSLRREERKWIEWRKDECAKQVRDLENCVNGCGVPWTMEVTCMTKEADRRSQELKTIMRH